MNYELAVELKKAGFPEHDEDYCNVGGCWKDAHLPTLSELIEACEKSEFSLSGFELHQETGSWKAVVNYPKLEFERGKTPIIAVAKLYIQLNKHE